MVHPRMSVMGGGERVAIHTLLAALKMGYDVSLLSEEFNARKFEDFFGSFGLFNNVRRLTFPEFHPKLGRKMALYQRLYYYQKQFRKVLRTASPFDIVIGTQDVGYIPSISAPTVQYCYFPEYFSHLESHPSSLLWRIYYGPARLYYRNRVSCVDRFISTSDYTKGFVKTVWGRDSETIYPPCPVDLYSVKDNVREDQVVTVGRIVPEKRMDLFVQIACKHPKTKFVIVGSLAEKDKQYYVRLQHSAPANLSFVLSPLRKVKDILARSKIYVHCTENEHFGITIVEAMAAGCVPVVHNSGGPREIVTEDVGYRWLSIEQAATYIQNLIDNDTLCRSKSSKAIMRAKLFDSEGFDARMGQVLKQYE